MKPHKDLPTGSQPWASEVDGYMKRISELEEIVRRLTENAGIDFSNPKRGINGGDTPSVKSPVGQKLASLADVQTYNVADKQVLTWSQAGQQWLPTTPVTGGINWELATDEEHLNGDLDADSDYYTTQVIGLKTPYPAGVDYNTGGTGDSYGLVGTSNTSAFLHGAQRSNGGPTRAHGYVVAQPYYCKMGVVWIDSETNYWDQWGEMGVDRANLFFNTPIGGPLQGGGTARDGNMFFKTNWFYIPQVNGVQNTYFNIKYPKRPVPVGANPVAGAMVYDMTLKKPIWWEGSKWVDAMGNDIPAATY